jgi:hypothetical protein
MAEETITVTAPATIAAPAVVSPAPTPAATPVAAPPSPSTVTITLDQLQTFTATQTALAQLQADQKVRDAASQAELVAALAKKGEVDNALALLRSQSDDALKAERGQRAATEERAKRYALDGEVARVLASLPLVPGAAAQLTRLFRPEFNVVAAGDTFVVQTPTLQTVEAFVAAQLAMPEYAHFVRAQNPAGGTGGVTPATQSAPSVPGTAVEAPKTLSDAVLLSMQQRAGSSGIGDGRTDPRAGFGLRAAK